MNFAPDHPQRFLPHVNEEFRVQRSDGSTVVLILESVDTSIDDEIQLCFSLLFRSSDPDLPQGIYPFAHDGLGECSLAVAPVRARRGQLRHEAVVNLLRPVPDTPFPG